MGHMMTQLVSLQVPPLCRHQAKVPAKTEVDGQFPSPKIQGMEPENEDESWQYMFLKIQGMHLKIFQEESFFICSWQFCDGDLFGMVSSRDPNSKAI